MSKEILLCLFYTIILFKNLRYVGCFTVKAVINIVMSLLNNHQGVPGKNRDDV